MSDVVAFFDRLAGERQGAGLNHEGQHYTGRMMISAAFNEAAVTISFTATGADGSVYHREMLMVGIDDTGAVVAFSASNNMPGLVHFSATAPSSNSVLFSLGDGEDLSVFREIITFRLDADGGLYHGFAWGMPGERIEERSAAILYSV